MPIRKLSQLVVNQIAAGEVIERPASVVKELIENSLDAGATAIDVQLEDGGRELIRVADNGLGIPADDLPLALAAHATSKIEDAADLQAIGTMGFRGEALASMASISRLRLVSRTPDAEAGTVIEAAGDQIGSPEPTGCAPGTVVEVRNLFFNTPARRKFMRGASTEYGHINELIGRVALAQPTIGFKLTHHKRVAMDVEPHTERRRRCAAVLGDDLVEGMMPFESDERGVGLWGLAGQPSIARTTARYQYVYVNGRPVRDRHIMHAIKEAYRGLIEPTRQPVVVLFIEIDPAMVDVNVHPAKSEVRFADANVIHGQVLGSIRQCLLGADLTPAVGWSAAGDQAKGFALESLAGQSPQGDFAFAPAPGGGHHDRTDRSESSGRGDSVRAFVDYFRRMDPRQKGFVYQQVRQEMNEADEADGRADEPLTEPVRPAAKPILQVHNSYVVTQDEQGIVIIDQHALHERVMFQRLQERIRRAGRLESQRLLTPVTIRATARQMSMLEELTPLLEQVGVEAAAMGPGTIGIHSFATLLFDRGVEPGAFLTELLEKAEAEDMKMDDESALHEVLDMMSCKAAIKAGEGLGEAELGELLKERERIDRASNCPHGRPTTIRLTLGDLEKHFKRT